MEDAATLRRMATEQDRRIADVVERERSRLRRFIEQRVPDASEAEDVLQDVFATLVEANRLLMPIEHVTGWLFRVARNRIADLFRRRRPESLEAALAAGEEDAPRIDDLLPSPDAGPDALYARRLLLEALAAALQALPEEQRAVFVAHEIEGRSFRQIAAETGVGLNTLLSRKRYAVLRLRAQLADVYDDFTSTRSGR